MRVDGLGRPEPVGVPDTLDDVGPGAHRSSILSEEHEQFELLRGERHLLAIEVDPVGSAIDAERPNSETVVYVDPGRTSPGASKHGPDPRDQLTGAEGLDHVVISAELKAEHPVELVASSGHHDDRHIGMSPNRSTNVVAVHIRQAEVEEHDISSARGHGLSAAGHVLHSESGGLGGR